MINRLILKELHEEISQPHITVLLGPRQVGKTTLLLTLQKYAEERGNKTSFFDLEQPQTLAQFNAPNEQIISLLKSSGDVIFIDEFHYIENASQIFKAIFDSRQSKKIICSGSSSLEIHRHLRESLAGRRFFYRIAPLQFHEIVQTIPGFPLDNYMVYGGMPGLFHTDNNVRKQQILNELLGSYILKDVKSLVKEENVKAFNHLLYLLAQHQGSVTSNLSLSREVGMSTRAIERYLDIMEYTYTNFRVYSYSTNLGNELKKSCKTYLYDNGIRNAILRDFSSAGSRSDRGVLHESFVFLYLSFIAGPNMEIKFWRTKEGDEVDFVLLKDRRPIPIEVKSGLTTPEIPRGLKKFIARYRPAQCFVVNESIDDSIIFDSVRIRFVPFNALHTLAL